eukprot:174932-Prorocentrum_minimum.AAC.1
MRHLYRSIALTSRCARVKDASHPLHQHQGVPVSRMLHIHYINIKVRPCQGCVTSITSTARCACVKDASHPLHQHQRCARVKDASHPLHQHQGAPVSRMRHIHYIDIKGKPPPRAAPLQWSRATPADEADLRCDWSG